MTHIKLIKTVKIIQKAILTTQLAWAVTSIHARDSSISNLPVQD